MYHNKSALPVNEIKLPTNKQKYDPYARYNDFFHGAAKKQKKFVQLGDKRTLFGWFWQVLGIETFLLTCQRSQKTAVPMV